MKIFNWVHRRFVHKDGLPQNGRIKMNGVVSDDDDRQFLIDQNSNNGFSADWKRGILIIGTFGYDPILLLNNNDRGENEQDDDDVTTLIYAPEKEQVVGINDQIDNCQVITDHSYEGGEEEEEYDNNVDDQEANPLLHAVYARDYEGLLEMKMGEGRVSQPDVNNDYCLFDDANTKKERTTLADLFSADISKDNIIDDDLRKKQPPIVINSRGADDQMMMKAKSSSNGGISFANKLDARPIHKLNRLMRRMMKRKIHPAAELGFNKDYYPCTNSKVAAPKCDIAGESASLLSLTS